MADGADDYFCAFNSALSNKVLGGYADWTGSVDGEKYTAYGDTIVQSTSVAGLKAQNRYAGKANVTITGNKCYTHGGGILSNGYLVIGRSSSMEVGKPVELTASKTLLSTDGTAMSTMDGKSFTFTLKDNSSQKVVATGTADETGKITFHNRLTFNADNCKNTINVFTYTLSGDKGKDNTVAYDDASVTLTITVQKNTVTKELNGASRPMVHTWYTIAAITAEKNETAVEVKAERQTEESHSCLVTLGTSTFTNQELIQISVLKKFEDNHDQDGIRVTPNAADFELEQNGEPVSSATAKIIDNTDGTYTIRYEGLTPMDASGKAYQYSVKEIDAHGYTVLYATSDQQAAYDQETITNQHTPKTTHVSVIEKPRNNTPVTSDKKDNTVISNMPSTPNTGDQTNAAAAAGTLAISILLAGTVFFLRKRYANN